MTNQNEAGRQSSAATDPPAFEPSDEYRRAHAAGVAALQPALLELAPDHGPAGGPPSYFDWVAATAKVKPAAVAPRAAPPRYEWAPLSADDLDAACRYLRGLGDCRHRRRLSMVDSLGTVIEWCVDCTEQLAQRDGPPVPPVATVWIEYSQLPPRDSNASR